MGCLPRVPWLNGSTFVSETHVDCEKTKEIYIKNGVKSDLVKVTGLYEYKYLNDSEANINMIREKFNIIENEFIIIFALPQLYEHHLISKVDNDLIIRNIMKILVRPKNCRIIISLHPKMAEKDYLFLENEFGVQISPLPLRSIMPVANVFISTFSSTVLWSIMLGIPSIIYDFFNLNYQVYDDNRGVYITKDWEAFKNIITKITEDKAFYLEMKELQKNDAKKYGDLSLVGMLQKCVLRK
jgi:CDP-glycerol glycerophosphotransferase (TagB/SpsB family)